MTWGTVSAAGVLLSPGDPDPVRQSNPDGRSSFLLLGDHAGLCCPAGLGDLGVSSDDWERHIACDWGTAALGAALAGALDAPFIHQAYSRLVIDCNRHPEHPDSIPTVSDGTSIPGNANLTEQDRARRISEIHEPYHRTIADALAHSDRAGLPRIVVSLHSFSPVWEGKPRPWRAGVLYGGGEEDFARSVLALLQQELGSEVGDNEPYAMDSTDYTIPRHAVSHRRRYVELEIRQDCLASPEGITEWAERLSRVLRQAQAKL